MNQNNQHYTHGFVPSLAMSTPEAPDLTSDQSECGSISFLDFSGLNHEEQNKIERALEDRTAVKFVFYGLSGSSIGSYSPEPPPYSRLEEEDDDDDHVYVAPPHGSPVPPMANGYESYGSVEASSEPVRQPSVVISLRSFNEGANAERERDYEPQSPSPPVVEVSLPRTPEPPTHQTVQEPPSQAGPENKSWASLFKGKVSAAAQQHVQQPREPLVVSVKDLNLGSDGRPPSKPANRGWQAPSPHSPRSPLVSPTPPPKSMSPSLPRQKYSYPPLGSSAPISIAIQIAELLQKLSWMDHSTVWYRPRGLTNRGNWCFVNSVLQALVACPPFHGLLKNLAARVDIDEKEDKLPIVTSMLKLIKEYPQMPKGRVTNVKSNPSSNAVGTAFEPTFVYKTLRQCGGDAFKVEGRQEDAEEFLSFLLNGLHEEFLEALKSSEKDEPVNGNGGEPEPDEDVGDEDEWLVQGPKKKSYITRVTKVDRSPISDTFQGQIRSIISPAGSHSSGGGCSSASLQPFFCLPLEIQSDSIVRVEDAVQAMVASQVPLDGGERIHQLVLESLPPVLILQLKMFLYDYTNASGGCARKLIKKRFRFGTELEIRREWLSLSSRSKFTATQRTYRLTAVIWHDGAEVTKGHYVADVFHPAWGGWLRHDDGIVEPVPESVLSWASGNPTRVPYLLIYRRSDTLSVGGGAKNAHATA